ncbi:hypothetical protein HXX76_009468 [Chlamydomonas incerta]|uniref:EF-hand domain-containing protein n=1 Tax=Chlamydomonas incerta TaxID=51695 RepID=A0A835SQQ3_CHLIN|nr:hypothetical protein HXX76_009468 [Chlamydomonas incerta]|eukprot:KAG2431453.1 hypothetical protein HXX76_009468 [Chlamydomonas incerta]
MAAVDRLRSFYGDQLLCRTGTLASIKSFGSAASGAASAVSGAETSTIADGAKQHRPGDEDVVIDPYQLDPDDSSSSSDDDDDDVSRPDSGSEVDDEEEGDLDETEWTSASGDDAGPGGGSLRSAAAAASRRGGARSVAALSAQSARTAKSRKPLTEGAGDGAGGLPQGGGKGVSIADAPLVQGPRGPRSVAASNWGARSRRSVATTAPSAATSAANSTALSAVPSGAPGGAVSVQKLDARLAGRAVRRRLLRRRGWEFDLVPDEVDYTLGRELPHVLTRPQPTADSDEEPEEEEGGGNDDDDEDSVDARAGGSPPTGPVLEAIKSYAHERAPEVVWSERVKHAKRVARQTGQTVTVRGRLEPKKRRELARKIQKWDNREWFNSRKRAPPAPPLHPAVERVIEQWFQLVDDDGGGTLDREELLTALQASDVPVKPENIDEMIVLMDLDGDGVISWKEFVTFFMYEFAAGKNLLSGEYVLPSGVALPFGAMIAKLKRDRLVADLMEGGHARAKWQNIAESPIALEDELGMMAAVELAMEEMKNPALGRARARAAKALSKLPAHLRTPSIARHLQRHPEVADKLLRAPSMAALLAATSLKRAPSAGNIMARLASTNSNGSIASRNSSMAGGGAGSTGGGSTGGGGGGGAGASGGRGGNVDLNVAVAMAAGLEWPVEGASFYNKRAKTVLRAACQKPPDAILRANQASVPATGVTHAASSRTAAAQAGVGSAAAGGGTGASPAVAGKGPSFRKGLSVEAVAAASATAAVMDGDATQGRGRSLRGVAGGGGNTRHDGSESSGEEGGGHRRRGRAAAQSDEEVLPWLVNAKRREEEERQELRERLMGGASSKSAALLAAGGSGRARITSASTDAGTPRQRSGLVEGEDEEEGLWVSPLLKRWLTVERERLRQPSGELMVAAGTGEPANAAAATSVAQQLPQSASASAGLSRAISASAALDPELSEVDVSSPAAATPGAARAMSSTLDGDMEAPATAGAATPSAARKPRRRMRFMDEQEDAAPAEEESTAAVAAVANSGAVAEEDALAALAGCAPNAASSAGTGTAVFLGSLGPHTCAMGAPQAPGASALSTAGASMELPEDPSTSSLRATRRSVLLSATPADGGSDVGPSPALQSPCPVAPGQSPRATGLLRTSRLETASPFPGGGPRPAGEAAASAAAAPGISPLRSSYGPALQQWAAASGDADVLEPLDAEEARELMVGITLQLSKEDTLYDIHTGHEADRPTTSDFRAALTRMRLAAAALVQSYALPPHPEYSGAVAPPAAGLSPEASQPQMVTPPLQPIAAGAAPPFSSRLNGHSAQPHQQPHLQLPLQMSDSLSTAAALSAHPSAVLVAAAHSTTVPLTDRARDRTRSGAGAAEGPSGGAAAGASARSRGAKVAQQVVTRAPGLLVAGVGAGAHPRANSPQPFSAYAQSPTLSYSGGQGGGLTLTPEASQPTSVSTLEGGGQALTGWAAQGVAALLQRHTAVELAAVQQQAVMRSSSPDAGASKSARPAAGGGGATARGSGLGPGAVALLSSRRAGGHVSLMRGAGSLLPMRAKSSLGLLRAADTRGLVTAPRHVPGQPPAAEHSLASPAQIAPGPSELLLPRASDGVACAPDFIHMPGAMPRLQSRYTAKRPVPGAAAAQQQQEPAVIGEQGRPPNGSRTGSRGGPRLPDPLVAVAEFGEEAGDAPADDAAEPAPSSPLWQDHAPEGEEAEGSDEPDSPRGWAAHSPHEATSGDGAEFGAQTTGGDLGAGGIPVHAWAGEGSSSAAGHQVGLPPPVETLSYMTDVNTHDGSRPPSAASSAAALRLRDHPMLPPTPPAITTETVPGPAAAAVSEAASAPGTQHVAQPPQPQLQLSPQQDQAAPGVKASRRELLLKPVHVKDQQQEQAAGAAGKVEGPNAAALQESLPASEPSAPLAPGGAAPGSSMASDKPSTPALARIEQAGSARGLANASASRLAATSGAPPAPQPAGALATEHLPVPPLPLQSALGGTPRANPAAMSPYTGSGVLASGFRLPNPSRLNGAPAPATIAGALPPGATLSSASPPGGRSPVSAPPVAGAGTGGQTSRLVSDLAAVAAVHTDVGADGHTAAENRTRAHTTLYLNPASGPAPAELPMLPPLAREYSGAALGAADLSHGTRAAGHRARQLLGPAAGRAAGRQWVSESLPALPVRSLSHEGEYSPLSPSARALGPTATPDLGTIMLVAAGPTADGRLPHGKQPLGALPRTAGSRGSAPQPFYKLNGAAGGKHAVNAGQPGRRRPAWGESTHHVGSGRAHAVAGSSPAAGRGTSAAGEAVASSMLTELPDIVALLSREPVPQRTGPIRIEKIDI